MRHALGHANGLAFFASLYFKHAWCLPFLQSARRCAHAGSIGLLTRCQELDLRRVYTKKKAQLGLAPPFVDV